MESDARRERLRQTFDAVAGEYQEARPEYPDELYEGLLALTGVRLLASRPDGLVRRHWGAALHVARLRGVT